MTMNILHITPDFNYACGRSYYVYLLLKYQKAYGNNVFLLTNSGDSLDRLDELHINYFTSDQLKKKNPFSIYSNIELINKIVKTQNINIIHNHHRYTEVLTYLSTLNNKNVKTILTALSFVKKNYRIEYKSDVIIAVSNSIKEMLIKNYKIDESKIVQIHNFTDTDEIHNLELISHNLKDHGKYFNILSIGRYHKEKNFEVLLKAFNNLKNNNIKLSIIGEGPKLDSYKKYISKNQLNIELISPKKNLLSYFTFSDICILPSLKDPFPGFMLQAGLHKKPFIGAKVDGIAELIKDSENGLLFEKNNEYELSEKIIKFWKDKELAQHCAGNLYKDVINNYTQEFIVPKIMDVYNELIST